MIRSFNGDDFVAPKCEENFVILYQDEDVLLINKPSGLLSLSGKNPLNLDSVHYRLVHGQAGSSPAFPHAVLPHRLDLGTSGLMVVGLNKEAGLHLNKQFQERKVEKYYIAMLEGWLAKDEGQISASIARDRSLFPRVKICDVEGKRSVSMYEVLQRLDEPRRSLVEYTPLTGRTHQLRIHSLFVGHPILGCDLYKSDQSEQLSERLLLHASELRFQHPVTGEIIHWHCPPSFHEEKGV